MTINIGRIPIVLSISILIMGATCFLLYRYKARTFLYYMLVPPIMFVSGYAFAWAYEVTDSNFALVMAAISGLIGIQGAWVLTTRLPR